MGIFDFLKSKTEKKFVSEKAFTRNLNKQTEMSPVTLNQLRELEVNDSSYLKLEFFFYTDSVSKAENLADELKSLNYSVDFGVSPGDKNLFSITGWTTKMLMTNTVVQNWTKSMCEIGYQFDCDFDGWGTTPSQY